MQGCTNLPSAVGLLKLPKRGGGVAKTWFKSMVESVGWFKSLQKKNEIALQSAHAMFQFHQWFEAL